MRRVWAAVISVWATIAIVGVLAWTNAPLRSASQTTPQTLVVKTKNGKQFVVVSATTTASHATTHASPPPP
jgi:hypothetical protein